MKRGSRVSIPGRFLGAVVTETWTNEDGTPMVRAELANGAATISAPESYFRQGAEA